MRASPETLRRWPLLCKADQHFVREVLLGWNDDALVLFGGAASSEIGLRRDLRQLRRRIAEIGDAIQNCK